MVEKNMEMKFYLSKWSERCNYDKNKYEALI